MKYFCHVDTPWAVDPDGGNVGQVALDFAADILGFSDVTGDSRFSDVPENQQGGNYPKSSGIQPDPNPPATRYGGSGDPDRLVLRCELRAQDEATGDAIAQTIDAHGDHWVLFTQIEETPTP